MRLAGEENAWLKSGVVDSEGCNMWSWATVGREQILVWHAICRPVSKHRMISISIFEISLKIYILIHNWTSKKICSIRYTQYVYILFWTSRKWLYLRPQNSTRSRPPKAADFFGCFFVFCTVISWKSKINLHILSISNGTYFFRGPIIYWNIDF